MSTQQQSAHTPISTQLEQMQAMNAVLTQRDHWQHKAERLGAVNAQLLAALKDCRSSLERLPDRAGAYRSTCLAEADAAIAAAQAKGVTL